jgi:hypothetical protein
MVFLGRETATVIPAQAGIFRALDEFPAGAGMTRARRGNGAEPRP